MSKNPSYFSDEEEEEHTSVIDSDEEDDVESVVESDDEDIPVEEEAEAEDGANQEEESISGDLVLSEDSEEDESDDDEQYLQKFDEEINKNYILDVHPECAVHNKTEVMAMCRVVRDTNGNIVDDLHRTVPFLTRFERARIIGQRAAQINSGSTPFVKDIPANIIDGYIIAEMELELKSVPFIIRRPLPNGGSEYWRVKDFQNLLA